MKTFKVEILFGGTVLDRFLIAAFNTKQAEYFISQAYRRSFSEREAKYQKPVVVRAELHRV